MAAVRSVPNEILRHIHSFVEVHDLEAFALTCVRFKDISDTRMKQHVARKKKLHCVCVNSAEECQDLVAQAVFTDRGYYTKKLLFNDQQGFQYSDPSYVADNNIYQQALNTLTHVLEALKDTLRLYLDLADDLQNPMLAILLLALPNLQHLCLRPGIFINRPLINVLRWTALKAPSLTGCMPKLHHVELLEWSHNIGPQHGDMRHQWRRYHQPARNFSLNIVLLFMCLTSIERIDAFGVEETNDCIETLNNEGSSEDSISSLVHRENGHPTPRFPSLQYLFLQSEFISNTTLSIILEGMHGPLRVKLQIESEGTSLLIRPIQNHCTVLE